MDQVWHRVSASILCVFALSSALLIFPNRSAAEEPDSARAAYVTASEVQAWLRDGQPVTFLDVREADEFAAAHLPGARNIVWTQIKELASELPTDQPIVLYCIHSAHRAPAAAKALAGLGFKNAYVLEGGISAWEAGGLTIRASDITQKPVIMPVTDRCKGEPPA
jgi:thiosulfate sulfurtransferase